MKIVVIEVLIKFVQKVLTDNKSALIQVMAWCQTAIIRSSDRPVYWEQRTSHVQISWGVWSLLIEAEWRRIYTSVK